MDICHFHDFITDNLLENPISDLFHMNIQKFLSSNISYFRFLCQRHTIHFDTFSKIRKVCYFIISESYCIESITCKNAENDTINLYNCN